MSTAPWRTTRPVSRAVCCLALLTLGALLAGNAPSLAEGIRYLRDALAWDAGVVSPVTAEGPFGVVYTLAAQGNAARLETMLARLRADGLTPVLLPVAGDALPNVLITFGAAGPYSLLCAHYDKSRETPTYQGAADNTAALAVLLALLRRLATSPPEQPVAVLFTSGEEGGLLGAKAFLAWSREAGCDIASVLSLDMLGRGDLALRPAGWPGLYFWLPWRHPVYDGRTWALATALYPVDVTLAQDMRTALGTRLAVYRRFAAYGDAYVFQEVGLPGATLSSADMAYLDRVWERDSDRVELLDEHHLLLACDGLETLVRTPRRAGD